MSTLARSALFFILAGLMEIGGGYLMWLWLRERWAWWVGALGALVLVAYETHPLTFCRNLIRENPYYVEFDEFIASLPS